MPIQTEFQKAAAYKAAGVTAPISADVLSNPSPLNIPTYTAPTTPSVAPPAAIDFGVDLKRAAADGSQIDLKTALDAQGQEAARKSQLETAAGIPDINKNVNELYAQDAQYVADLSNIASSQLIKTNVSEDRLAPSFAIGGEQAQIARQAQIAQQSVNIKRATNAALISAAQGRLSLAQDYVSRALDAEFMPLKSKIDYLKTVYEKNHDSFTKAEAAQLQLKITESQRAYDEGTLNKKEIYQTMLSAAQSGADALTLRKIQNAQTPEEAVALAGPALSAQQKFENDIKLHMLALEKQKFAAAQEGNIVTAATAGDLTHVLGNSKIGSTTKTNIANILGVMNAAETMATNNPSGTFKGISPLNKLLDAKIPLIGLGIPFRDSLKSKSNIENAGYIDGINLKVQQWASGASLTADQVKQVARMTPTTSDTDTNVKTKLNNLSNFMNDQIKGALMSEGITYTPPKVDLFAPKQTLEDIFK